MVLSVLLTPPNKVLQIYEVYLTSTVYACSSKQKASTSVVTCYVVHSALFV
jgi:hypothetical protein